MTKSQFLLTLLVAACAAAFGGFVAIATVWQNGGDARAQDADSDERSPPEFRRKVVEATEFRIIDDDGAIRGLFGFTDSKDVTLTLLDREEQPRALLSYSNDGSGNFKLIDAEGVERVSQTLHENGLAGMALRGEDGLNDLTLTSTREGATTLLLYGPDGEHHKLAASVLSDGRPIVQLSHNGAERLRAIVDEQGKPNIFLLTEEGASYWNAHDDAGDEEDE